MKQAILAILFLYGAANAQTPVVPDGGVLNGASFTRGVPVSPGGIVSIFGSDLASSLSVADSIPLSSSLNNVSVTVNGIPAPLYFVSSGQINAQLPWNVLPSGAQSGAANLVVTRGSSTSPPITVQIGPFSPGIFTATGNGQGIAIAINPDGSLAAPAGSVPGIATRPAKVGDALIVLGSGFGFVDHVFANGAAPKELTRTLVNPAVLVGGANAQVLFSGMSPQFPGVNQMNFVVPPGAGGDSIPLQVRLLDGTLTTDQVTIAIAK